MKNYTIPPILFLGPAILLQIALIVGMVIKFYQYFTYFYAVNIFISSLVVLWIVNDESNPAYKIAWIIPIMLFPIFGGLFYILIGKSSLSKKVVSKMNKIEEKTKEVQKISLIISENGEEQVNQINNTASEVLELTDLIDKISHKTHKGENGFKLIKKL